MSAYRKLKVSLPRSTVEELDSLARRERRTRSNMLDVCINETLRQPRYVARADSAARVAKKDGEP